MGRQAKSGGPPGPLTAKTVRLVVRALEEILGEIQAGAAFQLTRMTRVKRLCADQAAADAFALFIAGRSVGKLLDGERSQYVDAERWEGFITLSREGLARLEAFLAERSPEDERALRAQHRLLREAQNEHKNVPYGAVRLIVCWEAVQVETAISCVFSHWPQERARYGYELASDYVKRYAPSVFSNLNIPRPPRSPSSSTAGAAMPTSSPLPS